MTGPSVTTESPCRHPFQPISETLKKRCWSFVSHLRVVHPRAQEPFHGRSTALVVLTAFIQAALFINSQPYQQMGKCYETYQQFIYIYIPYGKVHLHMGVLFINSQPYCGMLLVTVDEPIFLHNWRGPFDRSCADVVCCWSLYAHTMPREASKVHPPILLPAETPRRGRSLGTLVRWGRDEATEEVLVDLRIRPNIMCDLQFVQSKSEQGGS